ncbi:hypothetical protein FRC09_002749 [Ceratobasidium sp. 395]|nr:hypothetical protein FRC09_002749 [Ceratobasidium sp. 395]
MHWIRRLEYPRVQNYAIPYITEGFYAVSVILIVLLATLNVAIAGNDVVTELKDSPNNTDTKWWAPKWMPDSLSFPTVPGPCQPLTLPQHSTSIRTNSTLPIFSYTLLNGLGKNQNGTPKWFDSIKYSAEPLVGCEVQNMTALINFQDRGHKLTSHIICSISTNNSETPPTLKFSTTFSRMANTDLGSDDIVDYVSSYVVPATSDIRDAQSVLLANDSTPLNMLGVLDAFGSEILKALWARKWTWKIAGNESWPDQAVVKWSSNPECWRADGARRCRIFGPETAGIAQWYSNTKGSQDFDPDYLTPMNTTLFNYFVAMRDAIHLDLGNVNYSSNIFLSTEVFQQRILHDGFMNWTAPQVIGLLRPDKNASYSAEEFWRTCTWGWGCFPGTWTDALLTRDPRQNISKGLPIDDFGGPQYATVIDVKYVCPVFKPKKIGSLLLSVFIGTFSMYTALYGAFLFVAPKMDEWYRRRRGMRRFSMDMDDVEPYSSVAGAFPYQTPPHSSNPYNTVFDAADMYQYHNEAVPRYDPATYPTHQTPTTRKGSLPAGAYLPSSGPHREPSVPAFTIANPTASGSRSTFVHTPPEPEQEALLPGCFEPNEHAVPSTISGNSARTVPREEVVLVPATTTPRPVSVENVSKLKTSESFKATVVGTEQP